MTQCFEAGLLMQRATPGHFALHPRPERQNAQVDEMLDILVSVLERLAAEP